MGETFFSWVRRIHLKSQWFMSIHSVVIRLPLSGSYRLKSNVLEIVWPIDDLSVLEDA